ncbi:MAG: IPT/TIG domain-containing protein [Deltaproteobacteria bacterium]|nr:IPT/TIG domain-containing protein [Deltaproteobacteria bacterium]MCB9787296.1 IPT/TIG domain-containing protein [Deltaproteobacteria bacterium]
MATRRHRLLPTALAATAALLLAACLDIPHTAGGDLPDSDASSDADAFVALSLTRIYDNLGEPAGGERVSILGTGFTPGATVQFGATPATGVLVLDEGQLNCDVPPGEPGLVDVRVELPDGQEATLSEAYLYRAPLRLNAVEPTMGPVAGGVSVTVRGEGFDADTAILVGGRLLEDPERTDATTITGRLPSRLAGRAGPVDVIASNGFEQRTLRWGFRYVDPLSVSWLAPAAGSVDGGSYVTLFGTGLDPETVVRVGGVVAETVTPGDGGTMTIRTPPGVLGPAALEVVGALASRTVPGGFVYTDAGDAGAPLELIHVWPQTAPATGGAQVAIAARGLASTAASKGVEVSVGGASATVVETDPVAGLIVVVVPPGNAGPAAVTVTAGATVVSRGDLFAYREDLRVDAITPASGKTKGGNRVTIAGAGLSMDAIVSFGHVAGTVVERSPDGALSVEVPPGVPGRVDVKISEGDRVTLVPAGYEYLASGGARLLAVSPPEGSQSGGRLVRVHGTGFRSGLSGLRFGDADGSRLEVVDDATAHLRAPRGEPGAVIVDAGDAGRLAMAYSYFDPTAGYGGTGGGPTPEALNVTVIENSTRKPVPEAFVIFWDDLGTPFQGVTDDRGQITLSDVDFGPPSMITAGKDNFTTASIVDFDARDATLALIPLVPSPPGGGGGRGPKPLPDGELQGRVQGFDKYIIPPLGSCETKLGGAGSIGGGSSSLCQACLVDGDCAGAGSRCTLLGEQGSRCTTACEVQSDCPTGFMCAGVGFGQVQCVPAPGRAVAWCGTSIPDEFSGVQSLLSPDGFTDAEANYRLDSRPGEHAVVCMGGYLDPDTEDFVPLRMGVRRHVFTPAGETLTAQDVTLDIPLTRTLRIRLDDPPKGAGQARNYTADIFLDLGSDGVFPMPQRAVGVEQDSFELPGFPAKFEESLYDASYTIYATALTDEAAAGLSNDGSFTLHKGITSVYDDGVFEVFPSGAAVTRTGITHDVLAMDGTSDGRVWAVGDEGRIVMWDGSWWALQQAPTSKALRAVWARTAEDAWAAGDGGAVLRWDGLVWRSVAMPVALQGASWWAATGRLDAVWLSGDRGVWRWDAASDAWTQVYTGAGPAAVWRGIWSDGGDTLWLAGDDGRIRRVTPSGVDVFDAQGDDLLAVSGSDADNVWAVGRRGRIIRWDGTRWFDYLPKTRRDLHAIHVADAAAVWAVGDAGAILRWDGVSWSLHAEAEHVDLRGVQRTSDGRVLTGGAHVLVLGPFLRIPRPDNPGADGQLRGLDLSWALDEGEDADFTYVQLTEGRGFPFWTLMVDGGRREVPLPDLQAAWGLRSIWEGPGYLRLLRVKMLGFDIDAHDTSQLSQFLWRSWATADFEVEWPTPRR